MKPRPGKYDAGMKVLAIKYLNEGQTPRQVQHQLRSSVTIRTIQRWNALYKQTSSVVRNPENYESLGQIPTLSDEDREFMLGLMEENPTLYLDEYWDAVYQATGVWVSLQTIASDLKLRLHVTIKKGRTVHPKQSATKRADFLHSVAALRPDMLVFLDECSVVERSLKRNYSRAKRGERSKRMPWSRSGKCFTLLPAICQGGVLHMSCLEGSFDWRDFEFFLKHELLPVMNPYPHNNSVLIMDNARIHHGRRIQELADARGVRIIYLPAYSPDLNPIEKGFSPLKAYLRRTQILTTTHPDDKEDVIMQTTSLIFTAALNQKLYNVCGYWA